MIRALRVLISLALSASVAFSLSGPLRADEQLDELKKFAPSEDYTVEEGSWLLAKSNFTGCAPWALQRIDKDSTTGPGRRERSNWHSDPQGLPERHARDVDFKGVKGLDKDDISRGHLSAAQFHKRSQKEMDSCHNLRNAVMQPQKFNAGSWLRVEDQGIALAADYDYVLCLTLVVWRPQVDMTHGDGTRIKRLLVDVYSDDELYRPGYLAKSYACFKGGRCVKMESYLAANSNTVADWEISSFLTAVDELERMTALPIWGTDYEKLEKSSGREDS